MPATALIAISANPQPERIIAAMRSGCSEYLLKPVNRDQVMDALAKVEQKRRVRHVASKGRVYTFLGVKGGSGVTTLTTHLAAFSAKTGARTLLIDHHPDVGDVSVYYKLPPHQFHFYELVNNTHRLDKELLQGFIVRHHSGVDVLLSPDTFGSLVQVSPAALQGTLEFLQDLYDVVLIDAAQGLGALNVSAIDRSDTVYLVGTPELPSVRNLVRYLDHLKRYSCPEERLRVVINRYSKKASITQQQIERAIHTSLDMLVPNCYADVIAAITLGEPLSVDSKSEFAAVVHRWAGSLASHGAVPARVEAKRSGFSLLGL